MHLWNFMLMEVYGILKGVNGQYKKFIRCLEYIKKRKTVIHYKISFIFKIHINKQNIGE